MRTQNLDNLCLTSTEPPDRFEHRQVSFSGAVLLQTLPSANPHTRIGRDAACERVNQRGFADSGFAGNEDYLPFSSEHLSIPALHKREWFATANNFRGRVFDLNR